MEKNCLYFFSEVIFLRKLDKIIKYFKNLNMRSLLLLRIRGMELVMEYEGSFRFGCDR
jgi:hypothetical protein